MRRTSKRHLGATAVEPTTDDEHTLNANEIGEILGALRLPKEQLVQRFMDKQPFILGKHDPQGQMFDGRIEQIQYMALKPTMLWGTLQSFNEMKVIVSSLMMGLALTLLLSAQAPGPGGCGSWTDDTCKWISSVHDWMSLLAFYLHFKQLFLSMSSGRVLATVPPHRLHKFMAQSAKLEPQPVLNREDHFIIGIWVLFVALGLHMLLRHPGPQGIVEAAVFPLFAIYNAFIKDLTRLSFRMRILWGLGWGHFSFGNRWKLKQPDVLVRIGTAATELADDIEAAMRAGDESDDEE